MNRILSFFKRKNREKVENLPNGISQAGEVAPSSQEVSNNPPKDRKREPFSLPEAQKLTDLEDLRSFAAQPTRLLIMKRLEQSSATANMIILSEPDLKFKMAVVCKHLKKLEFQELIRALPRRRGAYGKQSNVQFYELTDLGRNILKTM